MDNRPLLKEIICVSNCEHCNVDFRTPSKFYNKTYIDDFIDNDDNTFCSRECEILYHGKKYNHKEIQMANPQEYKISVRYLMSSYLNMEKYWKKNNCIRI